MSLQTIINRCDSLTIDRRRVVGVQYTRSEIAKISETPTRNPWRFNLTVSAGLIYGENRALLEALDQLDKTTPEVVSFNSSTASSVFNVNASPGWAYMLAYQGVLNNSQLSGITVNSFVGNQLTLDFTEITPYSIPGQAAGLVFKAGDFIQIKGYPYPFTIRGNVTRGTQNLITVTTSRPNFLTANLTGLGVSVGNQCQFNMFCPNMPTYKLTPGGPNALIQFTSDFQLYEYTGTI
jgi:hypothetical protein